MADLDRRLANASDTLSTNPPHTTETLTEDPLVDHMIRRPTEDDFEDVLTPEGNSGDIVGSAVSDSTGITNNSVAGTG